MSGVGVFPENEKILIGGLCFGSVALQSIGAGETEMGKNAERKVQDNATRVEKFLILDYCCSAIVQRQMGLAANIGLRLRGVNFGMGLYGGFEACIAFTCVTTCRLTKSPYATLYTGGSGGFVASTAAPIVTGWSDPVPGRVFSPRCGPAPFHGAL